MTNAVDGVLGALGASMSPEMANILSPPQPPPSFVIPPPVQPQRAVTKAQAKSILQDNLTPHAVLSGMKKFGQLANLVGDGVRARIKKRLDTGHLSFIADYSRRDIEHSGDIEAFLDKYIRPVYGGGFYTVYLVDQKGEEIFVGDYPLMGPSKTPNAPTAADDVTSVLRDQFRAMQDLASRPQPLPPDPLDQINKTKALMDSLAPKGNNEGIFAMMMQMQQQSSQQMMALLAAPKGPDPAISAVTALLDRMDRRLEKLEGSASTAPMPPPPPPPPGMNPAEMITAIASAASVFIPLIKGDGLKPAELMSIVMSAQQVAASDKLTARDMIAIFNERNERQSPPATLLEQIQTLQQVKEFAGAINPPSPGPQGASFWDAIISLAGNQSIADGLAKRIAEPAPAPQLPPERVQIESQPAAPRKIELKFPPDFPEKCKAIDSATDVVGRASATLAALQSLRAVPEWRPFLQKMLELVAQDEAARSTDALGNWLDALVRNKLLSGAGAQAALETFRNHFGIIRDEVFNQIPMLRQLAPKPPEAPPAAPAAASPEPAPVVQHAPSPNDAPLENGTEVPTGPPPAAVDLGDDHEVANY